MKKPDAITELPPNAIPKIVYPLPVSDLLYVGPATANKLRNYAGISTIGQLAHARPDMLKDLLGINGIKLWEFANGIDNARVKHKDHIVPIKSIGRGITCTGDLHTDEAVWKVMLALAQDVGHKLRLQHVMATGVQISLREKSCTPLPRRRGAAPQNVSSWVRPSRPAARTCIPRPRRSSAPTGR